MVVRDRKFACAAEGVSFTPGAPPQIWNHFQCSPPLKINRPQLQLQCKEHKGKKYSVLFLALEPDSEYVWHILGTLLAALWKQFLGCYEFYLSPPGYFWGKLR